MKQRIIDTNLGLLKNELKEKFKLLNEDDKAIINNRIKSIREYLETRFENND